MVKQTERDLLSRFGQSNSSSVKDLCTIRLDLDPLCNLIGKLMVEITAQSDALTSVQRGLDRVVDDVEELKKQETVADVKKALNHRIDQVAAKLEDVRAEKADVTFVDKEVARLELDLRETVAKVCPFAALFIHSCRLLSLEINPNSSAPFPLFSSDAPKR